MADAVVRVMDNRAVVRPFGSELITTLAGAAQVARDEAVNAREALQSTAEKVANLVLLEPVEIDGVLIQPTVVDFEFGVLQGVNPDSGAPYFLSPPPASIEVQAAVDKTAEMIVVDLVQIGGRTVRPTLLDFDFGVVRGDYLDTGEEYNLLAPPTSAAYARIDRAFPGYTGVPAVWTDWLAGLGYGQSNAVGAGSSTVLSGTALYSTRAITFNGGPKANPDSAGSSMTGTKNLAEDATSNEGSGVRGETWVTGAVHGLFERLYKRTGNPLADFPVVFGHTGAGKGGQPIAELSTTHYGRFTTTLAQVSARAVAAGKSLAVGFIYYDGNEANQGVTAQATWQAALRSLYDTMVADVLAETGQAFDPILIIPQKSWGAQVSAATTPDGATNTYPASVTLAATAEEGAGIFVAFPDYCTFFTGSDGIHRTALGHKLAGRYVARVAERVLFQGQDWRGLSYRSATIQGDHCDVRFNVPIQPIVLDYETLGLAEQAGFKLEDESGDLPILSIDPVAGDTLRLTFGRARDGAVILRGGLDFLPSDCGLAAGSAGTNLRDSDTETVLIAGTEYTLANWLLAFEATPLIMEA